MSCKSALYSGGTNIRGDGVKIAEKKTGTKKIKFIEEYEFIKELESPIIATNWKFDYDDSEETRKVVLITWADDGKKSKYIVSWFYQNPKSLFYIVGSKKRQIIIPEKNRYFNSNFKDEVQSWSEVENYLGQLKNVLDAD